MARFGRRRFAVLLALVCFGSGACLSPTLPMPPPEEPDVQNVGQGAYRLTGKVPEPARVEALNTRTELIFGSATDRFYSFDVLAQPGDQMQLWYTIGGKASDSTFFSIPSALGDASVPDAGTAEGGGADASPADAGDGGG